MLLDDLAIKYQQEMDQHREQIKSLTDQHSDEVDRLETQVQQLKVKGQFIC